MKGASTNDIILYFFGNFNQNLSQQLCTNVSDLLARARSSSVYLLLVLHLKKKLSFVQDESFCTSTGVRDQYYKFAGKHCVTITLSLSIKRKMISSVSLFSSDLQIIFSK